MSESKCVFTTKGGRHKKGIGTLKKGLLSSTGYSIKLKTKTRRQSLKKLLKKETPLKIFHQLNAVSIFNKNSAPTKSKLFKQDRNWIKKKFLS